MTIEENAAKAEGAPNTVETTNPSEASSSPPPAAKPQEVEASSSLPPAAKSQGAETSSALPPAAKPQGAETAGPEQSPETPPQVQKCQEEVTSATRSSSSWRQALVIVAIPLVLFLVVMTFFAIKDSFPHYATKAPKLTGVVPWAKEILTAMDVIFLALLLTAAFTDLIWAKVYNWCSFSGIGLGLALAYLVGGVSAQRLPCLQNSLLGLGVGFGLFGALYLMGMMGAGDVKLMGAIGALKGFPFILQAIFYSALMGGIVACFYILIYKLDMLIRGQKKVVPQKEAQACANKEAEVDASQENQGQAIPYGFAIAVGTLIAYFFNYTPYPV